MGLFVGIDPGIHTGLAIISDMGGILRLDYFKGNKEAVVVDLFRVINDYAKSPITIEKAVIRGSASGKKHGAIENRACGEYYNGFFTAKGFDVRMVSPMTWKGNTPKVVIHRRLFSKFPLVCNDWIPKQDVGLLRAGKKSVYEDALEALGIANYTRLLSTCNINELV